MPVDQTVFRQIENTVNDLRRADYNAFGRHIKKLSKLLHSDELAEISDALMEGIDIEAWIEAGHKTQGGTVGSARLEWPEDPEKEMGTIILLVDRFAADPDDALQFCHTFFYAGRTVSGDFQKMTADILVPFARDFIDYVKERTGSGESALLPTREGPAARKVFVVHGHDDHARESVARFVEKIGFQAIVLHEQANQGRTIIEKIEAHGEVGFAIVLLTPDDFGGVKGADAQPRARQNVVLELGYFLGRLGRSRVCALKRGDVEVPSDYDGVVYQDFDEGGGWKAALGRELQAAGFEIDWNSVMRG